MDTVVFEALSEHLAHAVVTNPTDVPLDYVAELYLGYIPGDANVDGIVNMGDVTQIERMILNIDPPTRSADANQDGYLNMADVTMTERIILGVNPLEFIKVASVTVPFSLPAKVSDQIDFAIVMPDVAPPINVGGVEKPVKALYLVRLDITVNDVLIAAFQATALVEIVEGSANMGGDDSYHLGDLLWQNEMPFAAGSMQKFTLYMKNLDTVAHTYEAISSIPGLGTGTKRGTLHPGMGAELGQSFQMWTGTYMLTVEVFWDDVLIATFSSNVEVS